MINDASVVIGGGNWGIKEADVLGYKLINNEYYARDIDFANSTAAGTYTDSTGIVRKAPYNLLTYSEMFSDVAWTKGATSVTANTDIAPNGTLTADTLTADGTNTIHTLSQNGNAVNGVVYTQSLYAKSGTNNFIQIIGTSAIYTSATVFANFDLLNGTIGSSGGGAIATITNVGNGWYRCTMTATATATTSGSAFLINIIPTSTSTRGASSALTTSVLIWGAQLVEGTEALPYFPTTTRLNVPRIDYRNADGSLSTTGRLLLEPQRTNLALQSEACDGGSWTKIAITATANTTTSPDGITNADTISIGVDGSAARHRLLQSFTLTIGTTYTGTYYLKANAHDWIQIVAVSGFSANVWANFNLANGTIGNTGGVDTTASIEDVGNGWYRCRVSGVATGTSSTGFEILVINNTNGIRYPSYQSTQAANVCYVWGAQLEAGAFATSYIPTTTAAVTRLADAASKTGVSSLIGQTEGTLFAEVNIRANKDSVRALQVSDGTLNNRIQLAFNANNFTPAIVTGGVSQASFTVPFTAGNNKIAIAYANNDVVVYLNGVQVGTDTSATIPACSLLDVGQSIGGTNTLGDTIAQAIIFPTRLTNSQLQSLTTL